MHEMYEGKIMTASQNEQPMKNNGFSYSKMCVDCFGAGNPIFCDYCEYRHRKK